MDSTTAFGAVCGGSSPSESTTLPTVDQRESFSVRPSVLQPWIVLTCAAFAACYVCSLTFVYIQADDASSLAYHALGRNPAVQPPYAVYEQGMDLLLGLLPASEPLIRMTGLSVIAGAGVVMVLLTLALAFQQAGITSQRERFVAACVCLAAVPELFYFGLHYAPPVVGMCCALGAHLLLRNGATVHNGKDVRLVRGRLAAAVALLVAATLFRFDLALYLGIIAADLLRTPDGIRRFFRLRRVRLTLVIAVIAALAAVPAAIFLFDGDGRIRGEMIMWARLLPLVNRAPDGIPKLLLAHLSVFTPAAIVLACAGVMHAWRHDRSLLFILIVIVGWLAVWPLWFSPKEVIIAVPALMLVLAMGVVHIMRSGGVRWRQGAAVSSGVLLILPWLVGIQIRDSRIPWGPGFEVRPMIGSDSRTQGWTPVIGAGTQFPTREGPRPLWGHAAVLFGGAWRASALQQAAERSRALTTAITGGIPILHVAGQITPELADAVRLGLTLRMPPVKTVTPAGWIWSRELQGNGGRRLTILQARLLDKPDLAPFLIDLCGCSRVVVCGWPSTMRELLRRFPRSMQPIGRTSALLDLSAHSGKR
jgi:hypothetical protein